MIDEFVLKVTLVGGVSTGKTTLVRRICDPKGSSAIILGTDNKPTVGVEFSSRVIQNVRKNTLVRLQLWDTAGTERYAAVAAPVYRNSGGIIAVCDVTRLESLTDLAEKWLPRVFEHLPALPMTSVLVVCNKCDLTHFTDNGEGGMDPAFTPVDVAETLEAAGFKGTLIMEGSALAGTNIEDAVTLLCNRIIDKFATTPAPSPVTPATATTSASTTIPKAASKANSSTDKKKDDDDEAQHDDKSDASSDSSHMKSPYAPASSTTNPNKVDLGASSGSVKTNDKKSRCPC